MSMEAFFSHTVCDLLIPWQEPFVNIPEEKIRDALRVVLGIIRISIFYVQNYRTTLLFFTFS